MSQPLIFALIASIIAIVYSFIVSYKIKNKDQGENKVKEISMAIHKGAMTFLNKEYKILSIFVLIVFILLTIGMESGWKIGIAFITGAIFSALAGNIGMRIATKANSRTAVACQKGINPALRIAFFSGSVMGLGVVGFGLLGVVIMYLIFKDPNIVYGFGFGASSIALFARVGGGIYTKAADVGADLVGKIESNIPEDDPRNPATIADNVGDNVGDVAGMGADLFESYVDSIIAAMVIGMLTFKASNGIMLPLALAACGILASIIGTAFVKTKNEKKIHRALNRGIFGAAVLMVILSYFAIKYTGHDIKIFYATIIGLAAGIIIGLATEYFTSADKKPAQSISKASKTGPATNIIQGLSVGMMSTIIPVIAICLAIIGAYYFGGLYGIAIAAVGMLSTLGITLATDSYGPVVDNAAGIAQMAGMGQKIRERAESLDAVGNTTAAIGKGFAIGSAALTALALFASFTQILAEKGISNIINISEPNVIVGLFIGGLLPFIFSALTIRAVGKAAFQMVKEVRRQFKEIPGILEGTASPDYEKCIDISTGSALKQMILPSLLAIVIPVLMGFILGPIALGGLLAGAVVTGFLMAIFMSNSGGAWDNAKKYIEKGNLGGKGSDTHKAAIIGDTVGDPFKDTSGPSLNILIKLISIVALIFVIVFI